MARKSLADLERDPKNVRYSELLTILRQHGCVVREGTKHGAYVNCAGRTLVVPRYQKVVKPIYVRLALKALKGEM